MAWISLFIGLTGYSLMLSGTYCITEHTERSFMQHDKLFQHKGAPKLRRNFQQWSSPDLQSGGSTETEMKFIIQE